MELKVWCDGIQRVVCGVSAATTCQEVVFALAHATGQTGRFILIEKFRHQSERLLAPTEHPLLVLSHWGEYASDVQFVMKRSDGPVVPTGAATASSAKLANTNGLSLATSPQQHSISSPAVNTSATSGGQQQALANGQPPPALVSPNRRDSFNNSINRKSGHRLKSDSTQLSPSMAKQLSSTATTATAVARNGNTGSASTPTSTHTLINTTNTSSTSISTGSHHPNHHHSIPGSAQPLTTASPVKQQVPAVTAPQMTANTNSISSHNNNNHNNSPIITSNAIINANNQLVNNMNHMNANMVHNNHNNNNHHSGDQLLTESAQQQQQQHQKFIAKNNTINNINTINNSNTNNNNNNTIIAINNTAATDPMITSPKGTGHRPRHPPPYSEAINKSALVTGGTGSPINNTTTTGTGGTNTSQHQLEFDSSSASDDNNTGGRQVVANTTGPAVGVGIGGNNKRRSAEPSPQTQSKQRTACGVGAGGVGGGVGGTGSQKDLLLHRDAIRLVDMQKETMRAQEMEMSSVEREITLIEKNLMDNELLISEYKCEMEAVHQRWLDQEVVIDQMDAPGMECELDELVARAASYEDDVQAVKHKLSQCETQIGDCRQQITRLMDQLEAEEAVARRQRVAANEAQAEASDETERLAEQLVRALRDRKDEFESQKNELQSLTDSIDQLDGVLTDRTKQMDRLLADLKDANLQGLTLQSDNEYSHNTYCTNGPSHRGGSGAPFPRHRSGSTRRMIGSPRELENAAPTNKNPHGVWV